MAKWLAGAAEAVITPPVGVDMTGFGGRPSGCAGIHDDLYARALVLEADGKRAGFVTTDLLSLEFSLVERIRCLVGAECGISPERLLLNSSHTHGGPATITLRGLGTPDVAYLDVLARHISGAIRMATDRLAPATLFFGTAPVQVGINRREKRPDGILVLGRNPDGPYDPTVYVLRVDHEAGEPMALLFSHASHPVTLGGGNLLITADFPGEAATVLKDIERGRSRPPVAMFAQGCCGDINSDRVGSTFEEAHRLGTMLGSAAAIAAEGAEPVEGDGIRSALETILLPFLPPPPEAEARDQVAAVQAQLSKLEAENAPPAQQRMQRAMVEWAEDTLRAARTPEQHTHQAFEIQAISVGDVAFIALPGEVFIDYALHLQAHSPFAHTVVLGYSNGCIGYVPTATAYPDGGYEVDVAFKYYGTLMIAPECERLITDAASRLLRDLTRSVP